MVGQVWLHCQLMVALLRMKWSHQRQWHGCVVAQPAGLLLQQQYVQTSASTSAGNMAAAQTNVGVVLLPE
jgi:hypothetical protein